MISQLARLLFIRPETRVVSAGKIQLPLDIEWPA
jgi:hypothetical protein